MTMSVVGSDSINNSQFNVLSLSGPEFQTTVGNDMDTLESVHWKDLESIEKALCIYYYYRG